MWKRTFLIALSPIVLFWLRARQRTAISACCGKCLPNATALRLSTSQSLNHALVRRSQRLHSHPAKLLHRNLPCRGRSRDCLSGVSTVADDLDDLIEALAKAKDVTAAARMDAREAREDEVKASINLKLKERELHAAECEQCQAQNALDRHIAQITASHLEDEPEEANG